MTRRESPRRVPSGLSPAPVREENPTEQCLGSMPKRNAQAPCPTRAGTHPKPAPRGVQQMNLLKSQVQLLDTMRLHGDLCCWRPPLHAPGGPSLFYGVFCSMQLGSARLRAWPSNVPNGSPARPAKMGFTVKFDHLACTLFGYPVKPEQKARQPKASTTRKR